MITFDAVFRKDGHPDAHIVIREKRPEAFYVDVERNGRPIVETWSAIGPAGVSLPELLSRYGRELGAGYGLMEFAERP